MPCTPTQEAANRDGLLSLCEKAVQLHIPLTGGLSLTHRCNLRCVHCYLSPELRSASAPGADMDTGRLRGVVDQLTEAGCLYLFLTGGEPLMHTGFSEIYRKIKSGGIIVTLFTNATPVTEEIADLLSELPPHSVEVSVYGASAETYESVTGVGGSFRRCIQGIELLLGRSIPVRLKTVLMTLNHGELGSMRNMARDLGVKFHFDAAVFPRLDGDLSPLGFRVEPEAAVDEELADAETLRQWADLFIRYRGCRVSGGLYACGAGSTSFHIDPSGKLMPCLMMPGMSYDLAEGPFAEGWNHVSGLISKQRVLSGDACSGCDKHMLCGFCPAFFSLENGSPSARSEYLCAMGRRRHEIISQTVEVRK